MKSAAIIVAAVLSVWSTNNNVAAFAPNPIGALSSGRTFTSTRLRYNIITPPDDENCELVGDCEESVFARKKRERQDADSNLRAKYVESGLNLSDIDRMETAEMYNPTGMGIIPGVQLSALMEDD
jgi:hypothetical protein